MKILITLRHRVYHVYVKHTIYTEIVKASHRPDSRLKTEANTTDLEPLLESLEWTYQGKTIDRNNPSKAELRALFIIPGLLILYPQALLYCCLQYKGHIV